MNSRAKISVIIPNFNYGRFIGEAIESVLVQTYQPIEIIVIDDGSTDDSVKIVESFGKKVKLIKQENGGVGKARNTGVKNSKGDFLAFLDADDRWLPQKIERQMEHFRLDPDIGLITTAMSEFDKNGNITSQFTEGKNGWCAKDMLLMFPVVIGPGSTALLKRRVIEQVGGFDENKQMYPSEDWEFCYRVAQKFKVYVVSEVLVEYRNHGGNGHLKVPHFERGMLLAFEKTFLYASPDIQKLKNQAYGNLHKILAGSYFQAGDYTQFIKHSIKSFQMSPENIFYFVKFPFRRLKKAIG